LKIIEGFESAKAALSRRAPKEDSGIDDREHVEEPGHPDTDHHDRDHHAELVALELNASGESAGAR